MYSKDFINSNFKLFESFGYLSQDIIQIIKTSPLVLSYDNTNLYEKIRDSNILKFSLELVVARYQFLEKLEKIDENNYRSLFLKDRYFFRKYGISKEQLLNEEVI